MPAKVVFIAVVITGLDVSNTIPVELTEGAVSAEVEPREVVSGDVQGGVVHSAEVVVTSEVVFIAAVIKGVDGSNTISVELTEGVVSVEVVFREVVSGEVLPRVVLSADDVV